MLNPRLLTVVCLFVSTGVASAEERTWSNSSGGLFHLGSNWSEGSPPGANDTAKFDLSDAGYSVSFTTNVSNLSLSIYNDVVVLELGASTYSVSEIFVGADGSNGELTVHGNAIDGDFLDVGMNGGTGVLRIEGGASVIASTNLSAGWGGAGADGTIIVKGLGSFLQKTDCCDIGIGQDPGNVGRLTIEDSATSNWGPGSHFIGREGGEGFLMLQTGGLLTLNDSSFFVAGGASGSGPVTLGHVSITSGADLDVVHGYGFIATGNADAYGEVTVSGVGSTWTLGGGLAVGEQGDGSLAVDGGGTVTVQLPSHVASFENSVGELIVTGSGSEFSSDDHLIVGHMGNGSLQVKDGASVSNTWTHLAEWESGSGHALVTGPNTEWVMSDALRVGIRGQADVTIDSGAYVSAYGIQLGNWPTGNGQITVTGSGSMLDVFDYVNIGLDGSGTIIAENGATILAGNPGIFGGIFVGSSGLLEIDGATYHGNALVVGALGGQAELRAGAVVDVSGCSVNGGFPSPQMTVTGSDTTMTVSDYFAVGEYGGTGTLNIFDGAVVTGGAVVGWDGPVPLSVGYVTVSGFGSEWTGQHIVIGQGGEGHLLVENGGKVTTTENFASGLGAPDLSTVDILGAGTELSVGQDLRIGCDGNGVLNIGDGAIVTADHVGIDGCSSTIGSGEIQVSGAGSSFEANNYIDVEGDSGTLRVDAPGLVLAGWITVFQGGTVTGDGTINVTTDLGNNGYVRPGQSAGTLTCNGNYANGSSGTFQVEVGGLAAGTQHDQLAVSGNASLAGRLELDLINGFVPSAGDTFDIMTYGSVGGRFETVLSDNLAAGLRWALDYNPTVLTLIACDPVADPSCDDCNLNGVLDGEDITNATSLDVDLNGIPDECTNFVAACFPPTDQWSCFDNWDLPGSQYPDDVTSAVGVFVTLNDTDNVTLDVDATIPGLRIVDEAELHATGGDLTVYGNSDTLVEGHLLAGDRNIDLSSNRLVLAPGGAYEKDVSEADALGTLTAGSAYLFGNACTDPPCPHGGEMNLDDDMEVAITGNFTLDGRLSDGPCEMFARDVNHHQVIAEGIVANQTFHTPPSIRILLDTRVNIGLNLLMQGAAGFIHESSQPVTVGDDWSNQLTHPECFHCRLGAVVLTDANPHDFEVAGTDVGPVGTVDGTEFVMGGLEVMDNAQVVFRDAFDNNGTGPANCGEALYVDVLTLGAGSMVILENCRVYYQTLVKDPSATVITNGCAELMSVSLPDAPLPDPSGLNKARTISMEMPTGANAAGGGAPQAIKVTLVSLHRVVPPYTGGPSIPFDSFEGQVRWAGPPVQYVESSSNPIPFFVSSLQCSPHYQNWSTVGLLHILGSAVVPSSSYEVRIAAASCQGIEDRCTALSAPLTVVTTRWGDVETPYNPPSATVQPDVTDISALVNKFRNATGAPIKARALLAGAPGNPFGEITPEVLNVDFGFSHISACVDAFRGVPYPYTIQACP